MKSEHLHLLHYFIIAYLFFCLLGCTPSYEKRAKEFMSVEMYTQAIELLQTRIEEKPLDAEAHFLLGLCYLNTRGDAGKQFEITAKLDSDYCHKISEEYRKAGMREILVDGTAGQMLLFHAIDYQSDIKDRIYQELLDLSRQYNHIIITCYCFSHYTLGEKLARISYEASLKVNIRPEDKIGYLSDAAFMSKQYLPYLKKAVDDWKKDKSDKVIETLVRKKIYSSQYNHLGIIK